MSASCPLTYEIFPKLNLFYCSTENSEITFDDLHQHVLELMSDYHFKVGLNGLYNFSTVHDIKGDFHKWEVLAEGMSDEEIIGTPAKTAIVLPNNNDKVFEVMRRYLKMTATSLIDYKLFNYDDKLDAYRHVKVSIEQLPVMV